MPHPSAFVDVQNVDVDYTPAGGLLRTLTGQHQQPVSVLRNISFTLAAGDWVTVYGNPGAGKTTLLRTLAGAITPSRGSITINGERPTPAQHLAAGYISRDESEPNGDTVNDILYAFGHTHRVAHLPARIGVISEALDLGPILYRPATTLATSERLKLNVARAALSNAPLILLDDTADELGVTALTAVLKTLFAGRSVMVATRFASTAETLGLPILLLHNGTIAHSGTCNDIADELACPRIVDVWIEGLRYDLLRQLRQHSGVLEVRLLPSSRFIGQRLRITLHSAHYLPAIYDVVSQAPLIKIEELPASLTTILERLA